MMYLLDTNHCSRAILNNPSILNRLSQLADASITTCVIVQGELVDMAERSQQRASNFALIQRFLQGLYIYEIDEAVATTYGHLKASLFNQFAPKEKSKRRKTKIQDLGFDDNDLWIAATAIHHNLTIVSSDSDFQRIQPIAPLSLEFWL
jgi:tRNA(fMet)-specific endonuclease VapC